MSIPIPRAAAWTAASCNEPVVGSHRTPIPERLGTASLSSCKHFAAKSGKSRNTPVTLLRGRARLSIHPLATGSLSRSIAITGISAVASFAAWTAGGPTATMARTRSLTKSAARDGKRDSSPYARFTTSSVLKRWDGSFNPSLIAVTRASRAEPFPGCSTPTLRFFPSCCAPTATGHANAAPPSSVMNSRLLIRSPRRRGRAASAARSRPSILAVWALMTSSNLLDCTTGRSAGLAPLRMRPV